MMLRCTKCGWVGDEADVMMQHLDSGMKVFACPDDLNLLAMISPARVKELFATQVRADKTIKELQELIAECDTVLESLALAQGSARLQGFMGRFSDAANAYSQTATKRNQFVTLRAMLQGTGETTL